MDEKELFARAAKGDRDAFEQIMRRYRERLANFAFQILADREDAVDVAQEVFVKFYFSPPSQQTNPKAWLYTVARNLAYKKLRKRKLEEKVLRLLSPARNSSPNAEFQVKELLALLTSREREVVYLKGIEEFTFEDIAALLEEPVSTVKSTYYRALEKLKGLVEKSK